MPIIFWARPNLRTANPIEAGINVHGPGEKNTMHNLEIKADDVKDDGLALRLAIATGSNTALHYLGEGGAVNYATAKEMGEPTARFFTERQQDLSWLLLDITATAYERAVTLEKATAFDDLQLSPHTTEVARADNESLAKAAHEIVQTLAEMKAHGWVDDHTAITLAFKFAGEVISEKAIAGILGKRDDD